MYVNCGNWLVSASSLGIPCSNDSVIICSPLQHCITYAGVEASLNEQKYHFLILFNRIVQWYSTGGTRRHLRVYVDYTICVTCIMYQQLWGYKVEEKLYLGVREQ
jgi:hypothetical protein